MGSLTRPGCGSHVGITEWLQDGQFAAVPPAEGLRVINIQHTAVKMNSQKGLSPPLPGSMRTLMGTEMRFTFGQADNGVLRLNKLLPSLWVI